MAGFLDSASVSVAVLGQNQWWANYQIDDWADIFHATIIIYTRMFTQDLPLLANAWRYFGIPFFMAILILSVNKSAPQFRHVAFKLDADVYVCDIRFISFHFNSSLLFVVLLLLVCSYRIFMEINILLLDDISLAAFCCLESR